jgi:hypothetical protein
MADIGEEIEIIEDEPQIVSVPIELPVDVPVEVPSVGSANIQND